MVRQAVVISLALSMLAVLSGPAGAQNLVQGTAETIPSGHFRLSTYPAGLFGRNGGPDRWGGAARLGYGFSDRFDVEGKAAFFDGFSLVGLDAGYRVLTGDVDLTVSLGTHKALIRGTNDSTALDAAWRVGGRVAPRLRLHGGMSASLESLDDVPDSSFSRVYAIPGLDYRLSRHVDLFSQFGVGLNDDSPSYFAAGFSFYLPTSGSDYEAERR